MKVFLHITLCLTLVTSCTNKGLDRTEAEKLIKEYYQYPNVEVNRLEYRGADGRKNIHWLEDNKFLVSLGMLGYDETSLVIPYKTFDTTHDHSMIAVYATNMRKFKEITGIRFDNPEKTKAIVEYTVIRYNITPFGKHRFFENEEVAHHVSIERYDDGWRVTSHNGRNYKESDFPDVEEFLEN